MKKRARTEQLDQVLGGEQKWLHGDAVAAAALHERHVRIRIFHGVEKVDRGAHLSKVCVVVCFRVAIRDQLFEELV